MRGVKKFKYYYKYAVEIKYKSLFKKVHAMTNLLVPLSILLQCLFAGRELFISWIQLSYQSVVVEEKKETKLLERSQKKAKLLWGGFWVQAAYDYQ